jgi:hypothetical protein
MEQKKKLSLFNKVFIAQLVLELLVFPFFLLLEEILWKVRIGSTLILLSTLILPIIAMLLPTFLRKVIKLDLTGRPFVVLTLLPILTTLPMIVIAFIIAWSFTGFSMM